MRQFGLRGHVAPRQLVIGLVNNSSDRGFAATESQFRTLLHEACEGIELDLRCSTCPEISRGKPSVTADGQPYASLDDLFAAELDALIVTGMEPRAAKLEDEPVWPSLVALVEWAARRRLPTIWSCLAAHAAVFHLDGISRIRLPHKLSGVFACHTISRSHPLMTGLPARRATPHSRFYDVPEVALALSGYQVLSRSEQAGADIFARLGSAPFLFFHGHPEYRSETLLKEFKRDVNRYLTGEYQQYPDIPSHYFSSHTEASLARFRSRAVTDRCDPELPAELSRLLICADGLPDSWRRWARQIYANWISSWIPPHAPQRLPRRAQLAAASYYSP